MVQSQTLNVKLNVSDSSKFLNSDMAMPTRKRRTITTITHQPPSSPLKKRKTTDQISITAENLDEFIRTLSAQDASSKSIQTFRNMVLRAYCEKGHIRDFEDAMSAITKCPVSAMSERYLNEIVAPDADISALKSAYPAYTYLSRKQMLTKWNEILKTSKTDHIVLWTKYCYFTLNEQEIGGFHCVLLVCVLSRQKPGNIGLVYDLNDEHQPLRRLLKKQGFGLRLEWLSDLILKHGYRFSTCAGYCNQWVNFDYRGECLLTATCELVYVWGYICLRSIMFSPHWLKRYERIIHCTDDTTAEVVAIMKTDFLNFWQLEAGRLLSRLIPDARCALCIKTDKISKQYQNTLRKEMARHKVTKRVEIDKNQSSKVLWSKLPYV